MNKLNNTNNNNTLEFPHLTMLMNVPDDIFIKADKNGNSVKMSPMEMVANIFRILNTSSQQWELYPSSIEDIIAPNQFNETSPSDGQLHYNVLESTTATTLATAEKNNSNAVPPVTTTTSIESSKKQDLRSLNTLSAVASTSNASHENFLTDFLVDTTILNCNIDEFDVRNNENCHSDEKLDDIDVFLKFSIFENETICNDSLSSSAVASTPTTLSVIDNLSEEDQYMDYVRKSYNSFVFHEVDAPLFIETIEARGRSKVGEIIHFLTDVSSSPDKHIDYHRELKGFIDSIIKTYSSNNNVNDQIYNIQVEGVNLFSVLETFAVWVRSNKKQHNSSNIPIGSISHQQEMVKITSNVELLLNMECIFTVLLLPRCSCLAETMTKIIFKNILQNGVQMFIDEYKKVFKHSSNECC